MAVHVGFCDINHHFSYLIKCDSIEIKIHLNLDLARLCKSSAVFTLAQRMNLFIMSFRSIVLNLVLCPPGKYNLPLSENAVPSRLLIGCLTIIVSFIKY